jgi:hypothetical protein
MASCLCGNAVEADGMRCAQCSALQALELKTDATSAEIHSAYEVLSKAWNPDRFQDDAKLKGMAEERHKEITAAYALLTRGSVQAAPFRSQQTSEPEIAYTYVAPEEEQPKRARKKRKLEYDDPSAPRLHLPMPLLIGCGVLVSGAVTCWLLFEPLDTALMRMPVAGGVYAQYKAGIRSGIQALKNKAGLGVGSGAPAPAAAESASSSTQDQGTAGAEDGSKAGSGIPPQQPNESRAAAMRSTVSHPVEGRALPLITAGMTKSEVITVQGAPTTETSNEIDYGSSKLYFGDGGLIGWQIDPSSPLRVKLWPDAMVDPNLHSFGLGSSKNDVIAVQGTPTVFTQNMFGYGRSEVYFKSDRVAGWKSDPATPLHVTSR